MPRLLDLYCGGGGAGVGYARAGFEVVGVDIEPQPDYPFEFHQGDALAYLAEHGHEFDAIHASPPCQNASTLTRGNRSRPGWQDSHVDLIEPTRDLLEKLREQRGTPYVIENVTGSALRRDLRLCGEMFGLEVLRHRYFEIAGWWMPKPAHKPHRGRVQGWRHGEYFDGPYFAVHGLGGGKGSLADWQRAMGIDWTSNRHTISEAIPPAYTELVGAGLLEHLRVPA